MKRIGILTFHRAHNYGAVLQAYGLQQCLLGLGFEVKFIDYKNGKLLEVYDLINLRRIWSKNPFKLIKKSIHEVSSFSSRLGRSQGFDAFIDNRLNLESNISYAHINDYFDVVFIGSDQVWNFHLTHGFDPYYWGAFKNANSKLILASYAASMEVANLSEDDRFQIGKLLKNFDAISVREDSLKNVLNQLTNQEISVVADPTLLVDVSIWNDIAVSPRRDKKYLLLYQVRNNVNNENLAKKIAGILDLEVVYLSASLDAINSKECIDASPADYLGLFKHASFVLCSSFHGTVFSVLFKIPFYAILMNDGKDSRNVSLLNFLGLAKRGITADTEYIEDVIDWRDVDNRLERIKTGSIDFIKSIIK